MVAFEERAFHQQRDVFSQLLRQAGSACLMLVLWILRALFLACCSQAEAADPAKAQERWASAKQAREPAEAEMARIEESILRAEAHRHG